ncbi:MAG: hypothetical protein ACYC1D_11610 [Acidimicrobiales bacterium]
MTSSRRYDPAQRVVNGDPPGRLNAFAFPGSCGRRTHGRGPGQHVRRPEEPPPPGARPLLAAAALYGFTYYSVGFPVLTVAQGSGRLLRGIGAFLVLQATSALTGYVLGWR